MPIIMKENIQGNCSSTIKLTTTSTISKSFEGTITPFYLPEIRVSVQSDDSQILLRNNTYKSLSTEIVCNKNNHIYKPASNVKNIIIQPITGNGIYKWISIE